MSEWTVIDLRDKLPEFDGLKFLTAELHSPLGRLTYQVNGVEQELGLRVDLDKRVIFDRTDLLTAFPPTHQVFTTLNEIEREVFDAIREALSPN